MPGTAIENTAIENLLPESGPQLPIGEQVPAAEVEKSSFFDFDRLLEFIKRRTGTGEISDYMSHPLNFNKLPATARIIRGVTGLIGAVDYALLDIGLGLLELKWKKGVS